MKTTAANFKKATSDQKALHDTEVKSLKRDLATQQQALSTQKRDNTATLEKQKKEHNLALEQQQEALDQVQAANKRLLDSLTDQTNELKNQRILDNEGHVEELVQANTARASSDAITARLQTQMEIRMAAHQATQTPPAPTGPPPSFSISPSSISDNPHQLNHTT